MDRIAHASHVERDAVFREATRLLSWRNVRIPDSHRLPMQALYAELIARKRRMFPDDSRIIADSRLKRANGIVSLEVLHADAAHFG
jgi:hypothetical protein